MKKNHLLGRMVFFSLLLVACTSNTIFAQTSTEAQTQTPTPAQSTSEGAKWDYHGLIHGQHRWAKLSDDYKACNNGWQSPIDIRILQTTTNTSLDSLNFHYKDTNVVIENTGHTIEIPVQYNINLGQVGGYLPIGNKYYALRQFHYHEKSEHTVSGKHSVLEVHFVHEEVSNPKDIIVLAALFKIGAANPFLEKYLPYFPKKKGTYISPNQNEKINLIDLLPKNKSYYYYIGSLTTPPCWEDVQWFVFIENLTVTEDQLKELKRMEGMGGNHRRVHELNDRKVYKQVY
jgi:carbonic anhydrase